MSVYNAGLPIEGGVDRGLAQEGQEEEEGPADAFLPQEEEGEEEGQVQHAAARLDSCKQRHSKVNEKDEETEEKGPETDSADKPTCKLSNFLKLPIKSKTRTPEVSITKKIFDTFNLAKDTPTNNPINTPSQISLCVTKLKKKDSNLPAPNSQDSKDSKTSKGVKDSKKSKGAKDSKDSNESKETKGSNDSKEADSKGPKESDKDTCCEGPCGTGEGNVNTEDMCKGGAKGSAGPVEVKDEPTEAGGDKPKDEPKQKKEKAKKVEGKKEEGKRDRDTKKTAKSSFLPDLPCCADPRPKRKRVKGKKSKANSSVCVINANLKANCCACCCLLAEYFKEILRLFCAKNDTRLSEIICELFDVTGCICSDCLNFLKKLMNCVLSMNIKCC